MLLRASGEATGQAFDLHAVTEGAAVARAALDLEFTQVTAPISGRISRYLLTEGNLVTMDSTLLTTIVSIDPIIADATGIPLDSFLDEGTVDIRAELHLARFESPGNRP